MKKYISIVFLILTCLSLSLSVRSQGKYKFIIIRHGEKQDKLENLNCAGLNRSLKLISVLNKKIGVPDYIYVPSVGNGNTTTHSRMFQTITPFAVNYNMSINSNYKSNDFEGILGDIKQKEGTILFVWEHQSIGELAKALGIKGKLKWSDSDFDSIWIITGKGKSRVLTIDKEGIIPGKTCAF